MVAIGDSLNDIASSNDVEDREDENDEETGQGKLSKDEEPGWVMGTIHKPDQHHMEGFRQKHIKLDELTQPGWGDAAIYFSERYKKYSRAVLRVPAVVKP